MADGFMDNSKGCVQKLWIKWNDVEENLSRACLEKIELSISPQLAKIRPRLNPYYRQDYSLNHLCVSLPTRDSSHQLFSLSFPCATEQTFKAQLLCKCQVKNDENNTFVHVFDWIYVVWCHTLVSWFVSLKYNFEGLLLHRIGENII